jgi:polysaccharide deacetylase family protein (PEP-CTERM system associated)
LKNILCVDVEDWYHPEYVKSRAPENKEERITQGLNEALQLLVEQHVNASFFMVGELAEKCPEMMRKIIEAGHEIAFHGYYHEPLWTLNADVFYHEVARFNSIVRSATREKCLGFRAPSYSMDNRTLWALDILEEAGYIYDGSVFPVKTPLYGVSSAPMTPYHPSSRNIVEQDESRRLVEFPALVYPVMGLRIPASGGFYLRLLPSFILRRAIRKMNKLGFPAVLSFHTWEVDSGTPRLRLGPVKSFVTYYNLNITNKKVKYLLSNFEFVSFRDYIEKHGPM